MPSKIEIDTLKKCLRKFCDLICEEAQSNQSFFDKINTVLMFENQKQEPQGTNTKIRLSQEINLITELHINGEKELRNKLENYTNNELTQIASKEGIKGTKTIDREDLINKLISIAQARLKQGESFTKLNQ